MVRRRKDGGLTEMMMRFAVIIGLLLLAQTVEASGPPESAGLDFMSWRLISQERVSDGGTVLVYELLLPEARSVENLEVFYAAKPWERARRSRRVFKTAEVYAKELSGQPPAYRLNIYYGGSARLEIMAGALIDGRFQTARTMLNVYGNADLKDPEARAVHSLPLWPNLDLRGPGFYRAMTGEPIFFNIEADHRDRIEARAFEQGREVTAELDDLGGGAYSYTPPLDPPLAAPGYSVKRDLVLVAALSNNGGTLSYYLPINRSYYGRSYLKPGLAVIGLTVLISLGLVFGAGRRFQWR